MPVYQLLGGKCREAVDVYRHASGANFEVVEQQVRKDMQQGYRHVRVQVAIPGLSAYGSAASRGGTARATRNVWEPGPYVRAVPKLFEHLRKQLGDEVELLHDMHERVPPVLAMKLVKDLEQFRPFFVEDPFAPEDVGYFTHLRQQCSTPLAMGELFNNTQEWLGLVTGRLIDFIRCHLSQVGGLTMAENRSVRILRQCARLAWAERCSPVSRPMFITTWLYNYGIQRLAIRSGGTGCLPGLPQSQGRLPRQRQARLGMDLDVRRRPSSPPTDHPSTW